MMEQDAWGFIRGRYLDYMVSLFEQHTDGSPLAAQLVKAAEAGDPHAWLAICHAVSDMLTALDDAQHGCCIEPGENGDREDIFCRKCQSLHIAYFSLNAVENMTNIVSEVDPWLTMEETANVLDEQGRFEGASQGFAKPGRHRRQSA